MRDLAIEIKAAAPDSEDALVLIRALDEDLRDRYPGIALHDLHPEDVKDRRLTFLIAHTDGRAIGCGAVRELEPSVGEVKRMFVQPAWRRCINLAQSNGIAVPAFSASLAYFDSYRTADLPQNLTQAQRDFFGAHTYQRNDRGADAPFIHTDWE